MNVDTGLIADMDHGNGSVPAFTIAVGLGHATPTTGRGNGEHHGIIARCGISVGGILQRGRGTVPEIPVIAASARRSVDELNKRRRQANRVWRKSKRSHGSVHQANISKQGVAAGSVCIADDDLDGTLGRIAPGDGEGVARICGGCAPRYRPGIGKAREVGVYRVSVRDVLTGDDHYRSAAPSRITSSGTIGVGRFATGVTGLKVSAQ
jgi:hypothetical protein